MLSHEDRTDCAEHELVRVFRDDAAGLLAVVAVHSTALGPSMGGVRRRDYASLDEAVADALRLSAAMTLKSSAAGLPLGGGKSVIVDARADADDALLDAFAAAIASLGGRYVAAEDIGTTPRHMDRIAARTPWVAGQSAAAGGNGDPSPATAATVFGALSAAAAHHWYGDGLADRTVGVLGVGKVGSAVARMAAAEGAHLVLADAVPGRAEALAAGMRSAEVASPSALLDRRLDVLMPCATGGLVDIALADHLDVEILCGAANNILADDVVATVLHERRILYVPDFVANAGGIIHVGGAFLGWDENRILECSQEAVDRVADVLAQADSRATTPLQVALERAHQRLATAHPTIAN